MNLGLIFFCLFMATLFIVYALGIIVIVSAFGYFVNYLLEKWKENKT